MSILRNACLHIKNQIPIKQILEYKTINHFFITISYKIILDRQVRAWITYLYHVHVKYEQYSSIGDILLLIEFCGWFTSDIKAMVWSKSTDALSRLHPKDLDKFTSYSIYVKTDENWQYAKFNTSNYSSP